MQLIKIQVNISHGYVTLVDFGYLDPKDFLSCLPFQCLDFERTQWRLFQKKHAMHTILDIYVWCTHDW